MTTPPPSDPFGAPTSSGEPSYGQEQPGPQQSYGRQPSYGSPQPGYSPPGYGQGHGYGWQPGGYGPPPQPWQPGPPTGQVRTEPKAIIALVCAIGSWVVFPVLPAIAALLVASAARRDIDASGGWLTGDGMVTAAKWVAWANLVLSVLAVIAAVLLFAVAVPVSVG